MSLATSNIFAALDTKKKKKSSKASRESADKKKKSPKPERPPEAHHLFSGQGKKASNWADTDEEDDFEDDIGPLPQSWLPAQNGASDKDKGEEDASDSGDEARVHEIHEELGLELAKEEEDEEEEEKDDKVQSASAEVAEMPRPQQLPATAPQERQISKKEQKRLELEEMNRVLAELGIEAPSEQRQGPESPKVQQQHAKNGENAVQIEEAAAGKRKKKKEKKAAVEEEVASEAEEEAASQTAQPGTEAAVLDPNEARRLLAKKKAAAAAKKSTSSAASLAAKEAKERAVKKLKIKDKKNYNQV